MCRCSRKTGLRCSYAWFQHVLRTHNQASQQWNRRPRRNCTRERAGSQLDLGTAVVRLRPLHRISFVDQFSSRTCYVCLFSALPIMSLAPKVALPLGGLWKSIPVSKPSRPCSRFVFVLSTVARILTCCRAHAHRLDSNNLDSAAVAIMFDSLRLSSDSKLKRLWYGASWAASVAFWLVLTLFTGFPTGCMGTPRMSAQARLCSLTWN